VGWVSFKHDITHRHVFANCDTFQMQVCLRRFRKSPRFVVKVLVHGDNRSHAVATDADTFDVLLKSETPSDVYRWLVDVANHRCSEDCRYV
jgi:hypothetical protein